MSTNKVSIIPDIIKKKLILSHLIGEKVKLTHSGKYLKGLCPFHNEKTPSFSVDDEKGNYHCFGCGAHGDIISFIMEMQNISFKDALSILAEKAGVDLSSYSSNKNLEKTYIKEKRYFEVMSISTKIFQKYLDSRLKKNHFSYLNERGIDKNDVSNFMIGLSPGRDFSLTNYLIEKGYSDKELIEFGLSRLDKKNNLNDFFNNRLMFPILDFRDRVIGFGARALRDEMPKYLNSPENNFFKKRNILYNIQNAKTLVRQKKYLVLVEGYTDTIALNKIGIPALAPLGTSISIEQINLAWSLVDEPIICMDGDSAGKKASERLLDIVIPFLSAGKSLNFIQLEKDKDPDSLLREDRGEVVMRGHLDKKKSFCELLWEVESGKTANDTPERITGLKSRLKKRIGQIKDIELKRSYNIFLNNKISDNFENFNKHNFNKYNFISRKDIASDRRDKFFSQRLKVKDRSRVALVRERTIVGAMINNYKLLVRNDEVFAEIPIANFDLALVRSVLIEIISTTKAKDSKEIKYNLVERGFSEILKKHFITLDCIKFTFIERYAKEEIDINEAQTGWNDAIFNQRKWYKNEYKK